MSVFDGVQRAANDGALKSALAATDAALDEVRGCCTPWARVEPVCEGCPIWGGEA